MKLWIDAQLSPKIAQWITENYSVKASAVRDLGFRDASDGTIFAAARVSQAVVVSKDSDFVRLIEENGTPPQLIWIRCGNSSNENLKRILESTIVRALDLLRNGEAIIEIEEA